SPGKKVVKPQGISNEILKHLNEYALNIMLQVYNACITLYKISASWKLGL
ncbi:43552_t:CDS:1, partial [Gigaspora margarita]